MCCERVCVRACVCVCVCVCVSAWPLGSQGYFSSVLSLSIQGGVRPLIDKLPKSESETAEPPALNFTCSPPWPPPHRAPPSARGQFSGVLSLSPPANLGAHCPLIKPFPPGGRLLRLASHHYFPRNAW